MRTYKWTETVEHEQIEPKIGEVFEWKGKKLKCEIMDEEGCAGKCPLAFGYCDSRHTDLKHPICFGNFRKDRTDVLFVKYEEPKFTQEEAQEMYDTLGTIEAMLNDWATHEKIETFIWKGMFEYHANGIRTFLKGIKNK